jgi:hypothetical protein
MDAQSAISVVLRTIHIGNARNASDKLVNTQEPATEQLVSERSIIQMAIKGMRTSVDKDNHTAIRKDVDLLLDNNVERIHEDMDKGPMWQR